MAVLQVLNLIHQLLIVIKELIHERSLPVQEKFVEGHSFA